MKGRRTPRRVAAGLVGATTLVVALGACGSSGDSGQTRLLGAGVTPAPRASSLAQLNVAAAAAGPLDCTPHLGTPQDAASNLAFAGPCTFTLQSGMPCVRKIDDFYVYIKVPLPDNGQFLVNINVEKYKGPGDYHNATQIDMEVSRGVSLNGWSQYLASSTVASDGRHVHVEATDLTPQPGTATLGTEHISGDVYCAT